MVNERKYLKKETPSQIYETKLQNNIVIVSSKSVTLIDPYNTTKQQNLTREKKKGMCKQVSERIEENRAYWVTWSSETFRIGSKRALEKRVKSVRELWLWNLRSVTGVILLLQEQGQGRSSGERERDGVQFKLPKNFLFPLPLFTASTPRSSVFFFF